MTVIQRTEVQREVTKRLYRFKLNNEGVALIYALIAGTVAMVFCLMLLMVSYNLYSQVNSNTTDMQLKVAAESFHNALWSEFDSATYSSLNRYIDTFISDQQIKKNSDMPYEEELNLLFYYDDEYGDGNSMGNYCIYLTVMFDVDSATSTKKDVDVIIKCMRGIPISAGGSNYRMDDKDAYVIEDTLTLNVNRL